MKPYRILFASIPADGHFNPLTGLALHLKKAGHDVRWYTGRSYKDKVLRLNIPYFPFKKALEINLDYLDEIFPERKKHKSQTSKLKFDLKNLFILRSTEYYEDICEIYENFQFDILIAEPGFTAIPLVKEHLGVPVISVGVVPLMENSSDLAPYGLGLTPSDTFWGRKKQDVMRWMVNSIVFRQPTSLMKKILKQYGVKTRSKSVFDLAIEKSDFFLQSGTPGFEYKRTDLSSNVRFIGALLPSGLNLTKSFSIEDKLKKFSKVILVTQGTAEKDPDKLLMPTLEAFKNTDTLVIATTGGSKTKELKDWYNSYENIIVEDFIPFKQVMPYANVFITNGGYGGVLLAIQHKLPMVVAGIHEGKNEINARVGYFKLGIDLKTEFPESDQIKKAVSEVFSDFSYYEKVSELQEEFETYNPGALCEKYVNQLLNNDFNRRDLNGFLKLGGENEPVRKFA